MIRAKYRCLSITERLTGTTVELKPVIAKSESYPGGSEENRAFFKATPTGDAALSFRGTPAEVPFKVGAYYFFDLEMVESKDGRPWKLWKVEHTEQSIGIALSLGWDTSSALASASFSASIENQDAWPAFVGKSGSWWRVEVVPADAPPEGAYSYP